MEATEFLPSFKRKMYLGREKSHGLEGETCPYQLYDLGKITLR